MAKIQAQWRMFATRRLFRQKKAAQIKISAEWRMWKCKCHYQKMRNAAIVIQSYQRGMEARKLLKEYLTREFVLRRFAEISFSWARPRPISGKLIQQSILEFRG